MPKTPQPTLISRPPPTTTPEPDRHMDPLELVPPLEEVSPQEQTSLSHSRPQLVRLLEPLPLRLPRLLPPPEMRPRARMPLKHPTSPALSELALPPPLLALLTIRLPPTVLPPVPLPVLDLPPPPEPVSVSLLEPTLPLEDPEELELLPEPLLDLPMEQLLPLELEPEVLEPEDPELELEEPLEKTLPKSKLTIRPRSRSRRLSSLSSSSRLRLQRRRLSCLRRRPQSQELCSRNPTASTLSH